MTKIFLLLIALATLGSPAVAQRLDADDFRRHIRKAEAENFLQRRSLAKRVTDPRQNGLDVGFYRLNLELFPQQRLLQGSVLILGSGKSDNLDRLVFDLFANMTVDSVISGGRQFPFERRGDRVEIPLSQPLRSAEPFAVEIFYRGSPRRVGFGSFNWEHQGKTRIWTLSEPYGAPSWWPCKDDPADKADSVFINVTVPENLIVASNGLLTGVTPGGEERQTYHWETRYPISTYLVVVAAADYVTFSDWYVSARGDSLPLCYYAFPEQLSEAQQDFRITAEMMAVFADLWGEYPFRKEKYGMASVPRGASMEHQTLTTLSAPLITGSGFSDFAVAHELAHHWFGDYITIRYWPDIWLNEGFATYCESLWQERAYGREAYRLDMDAQDPGAFEGSVYVEDTTDVRRLFSRTVYNKGSWVLHMLRGVLGDSLFFTALRRYAGDPHWQYGNATTADFQEICETVSGRSLEWYFEQWLYRPGRPIYRYRWETKGDAPPYTTRLELQQSNTQPYENTRLYKMPLEVRLSGKEGETTLTVWDSLPTQQFEFQTAFRPTRLSIDPDNWVLKKLIDLNAAEIAGIPRSFQLRQNYPNPFNSGTVIEYGLPKPGSVHIKIFNLLGQRVFSYRSPWQAIGFHQFTWPGNDDRGQPLPSGIYVFRARFGDAQQARKLVLLR